MSRAPVGHKIIDECAEGVEEEVLNHHLQDEDLRALRTEGVAAVGLVWVEKSVSRHRRLGFRPQHSHPSIVDNTVRRNTKRRKEPFCKKENGPDSQDVQPRTRTSHTRPKTHTPIAKTTQIHHPSASPRII
jgi:hypothetical protein